MTYTNVTEKQIYLRFPSSHFLPGAVLKPFFVVLQIHGVNEDFTSVQFGMPANDTLLETQLAPVLERFGMFNELNQIREQTYAMPVELLMYLMVEAQTVKRVKTSRMRTNVSISD
ncbi:hypothetical protein MKQ68_05835 [Chitinophaga horti]|uniref:Uncharacterized protein n=1 Tax=Chitinophaga horti TaxID=2920382 RepID=A0ABY6J4K9_9BACT|nr:hypothetical protein [Chitinophaga horti]UYQ94611.1 hypothetical protein MKQ68_05835 [Chitinophaga horti]